MLKKLVLGIITIVFVLSSGIVIGAKYGPAWQRTIARMEQRSALVDAALRAEGRGCELMALDWSIQTSVRPVYMVPAWSEPAFWFDNARLACEWEDQNGRPVHSHIERPNCNRAAVEREWLQDGDFTASLLGNCGITPL